MADFGVLPKSATLEVEKFTANVPERDIQDFRKLLGLSKIGPITFENIQEGREYGVQRKWLAGAKRQWLDHYDWRNTEKEINSFPNFKAKIETEDGDEETLHFVALFSQKPGAIPIVFFHGWPGSFLEYLDLLRVAKKRYPSPKQLPYHLIVPSLPGYTFSSGPPVSRNFTVDNVARMMQKLMAGLGLGTGYIAQGGDLGSIVARILAVKDENCKALHLSSHYMRPPENASELALTDPEREALDRTKVFSSEGTGYSREHATRPATIGLVLSSSPLALLAWIGEKFLAWSDSDPPLSAILDAVTLYWLTETFARSIYPYRRWLNSGEKGHGDPTLLVKKPFGCSWFPMDITPPPKSWVATNGNVVWWKVHDKGGHFSAMEMPEALMTDLEDFVAKAYTSEESSTSTTLPLRPATKK